MEKKLIFTLSLFIVCAVMSVVVLILSLSETKAKETQKLVYSNTVMESYFQNKDQTNLKVLFGSHSENISLNTNSEPSYSRFSPNLNTAPTTIFMQHFNTQHPWSVYDPNSEVYAISHLNSEIGKQLLVVSETYNREPTNAELEIKNDRAIKFIPSQNGQQLLISDSVNKIVKIINSLAESDQPVRLRFLETEPKTSLADTNDLGIKKLVAQGVSDFSGSTRSRVHNITVGASKFDGLIIKPGEEFSFNKYLGSVTAADGYLPELVIKAEGTVPEFGGGLCQVSSTAFRAAFFGGLPINQRKNHSYAVSYYRWINEDIPPSEGLDATIYPGVVDMKFTNDTGYPILISTKIENTRLYFNFYGTPDQRKVEVDGPYTYDRQASGAVKATVSRTVTKNGEKLEQTFNSTYVSPNLFPRTYEYADNKNEENSNPEPNTDTGSENNQEENTINT